MSFNASLNTQNSIATITLSGELDAVTASTFKAAIEAAAASSPRKLVIDLQALNYMSSAGLRVLIFAKQKIGQTVDFYLVNPQEMVRDTITKTGFDQSVYLVDELTAAQLEVV